MACKKMVVSYRIIITANLKIEPIPIHPGNGGGCRNDKTEKQMVNQLADKTPTEAGHCLFSFQKMVLSARYQNGNTC